MLHVVRTRSDHAEVSGVRMHLTSHKVVYGWQHVLGMAYIVVSCLPTALVQVWIYVHAVLTCHMRIVNMTYCVLRKKINKTKMLKVLYIFICRVK